MGGTHCVEDPDRPQKVAEDDLAATVAVEVADHRRVSRSPGVSPLIGEADSVEDPQGLGGAADDDFEMGVAVDIASRRILAIGAGKQEIGGQGDVCPRP